MASFKKIPIVQITKFDKTKMFEYIVDKYSFNPINKSVIESAYNEKLMIEQLVGTTEESDEQLELSKDFLNNLLKAYSFYLKEEPTIDYTDNEDQRKVG